MKKNKWVSFIVKFLYVVLDLAFFCLVLPLFLTGCFRLQLSGKLFSLRTAFIFHFHLKQNWVTWNITTDQIQIILDTGYCQSTYLADVTGYIPYLHHRNSDQCSWIRCKTRIKEVMKKKGSCFVNMGSWHCYLNNCSLAAYMSEEEVLKGIIYPPISR